MKTNTFFFSQFYSVALKLYFLVFCTIHPKIYHCTIVTFTTDPGLLTQLCFLCGPAKSGLEHTWTIVWIKPIDHCGSPVLSAISYLCWKICVLNVLKLYQNVLSLQLYWCLIWVIFEWVCKLLHVIKYVYY